MVDLTIESKKRLDVIKKIYNLVKESKLTGLLVTGSLAWGKGYAVNSKSDIDFYLLGDSLNDYLEILSKSTFLTTESKETIKNLLWYNISSVDTRSIKTTFDGFKGTIYLFLERDIIRLSKNLDTHDTILFDNLRPHFQPQTKNYKSLNGTIDQFTTPISKLINTESLWLRRDPLILYKKGDFLGSIFLSHLLTGEIYFDRHGIFNTCKSMAQKSLKHRLENDRSVAFKQFKNYLPRIERMNTETIENLFKSVWN